MSTPTKPYKDTLNLPVTRFDMKANLTVREPAFQKRWSEQDLYGAIRRARADRPRRVLHDGPPYANGDIHMGHLLNKVLKDMVVRWYTMRGFDSPYVPGWDCHGLPIEHKVMKDLGSKGAGLSRAEIRARCQVEAMKWVEIQGRQFQRLGVSGDWEHPYLTLDPRYEAAIVDVLADLVERGFVLRQLKPIHWCFNDRTALAEAELEYEDETTSSIYVNFTMLSGVPAVWGEGPWHVMIWTTTPWTLPANVAIAAHPDLEYAGVRYVEPESGRAVQTILAAELVGKVMALGDITEFAEVGRCRGRDLEHALYRHPFLDREGPIVLADYVSVEDGTGLVHTAPGHGTEDYRTGLAYGLPVLSPVDEAGRYTAEGPPNLVGQTVFAANPKICEMLRYFGYLFKQLELRHSYPHCWRCKKPVIFRATDQWFISVDHDDLRKRTLEAIDGVRWLPSWGRTRIESMVALRPDWCISRQRSWGVPIPALACEGCGEQVLTAETVRHFRDVFRTQGADAWYTQPLEAIAPPGLNCSKCGGTAFRRAEDILDVWFESGSSHRAVLDERYGFALGYPAAMYLEGSDQHRGWFQSSILTAVGTTGRAPFETVLTHGFIVDDKGHKMAKSGGNAIAALKATETYGADVLRLYVASLDYADDIRMSERGIKETSEAYRKIRNTFRYFLGNLGDYAGFDPTSVPETALHPIDRWALGQLNAVIRDVTDAYDRFEFYRAYQRIYQFCVVDLSSFYLDVLKDRLYADAAEGPDRRAAQVVLASLHDVLTRLLAPILVHTAEELWDMVPASADRAASVHLADWPETDPRWDDPARDELWEKFRAIRTDVLRTLEKLRASKTIGSAAEASVTLGSDDPVLYEFLVEHADLLATLCLVSEVVIAGERPGGLAVDDGQDMAGLWVSAVRSVFPKCERCWNLRPTVGASAEHPTLCGRCVAVLSPDGGGV